MIDFELLKQSFHNDIPGWVTAFAAIVALVFGIWQVLSAKYSQREATANDIWMNYEQFGLEYPKYANPELSVLDYEKETLDWSRQEFYRYEWFVSHMLLACDAVLVLGHSNGWEGVVKNNLSYHRDYLKSEIFEKQSLHVQSLAIQRMIKELP
jgi:hypothetical protein